MSGIWFRFEGKKKVFLLALFLIVEVIIGCYIQYSSRISLVIVDFQMFY